MESGPELQQALRWRRVETQKTGRLPGPLLQPGQPGGGELEGGTQGVILHGNGEHSSQTCYKSHRRF